MAQTKTPATQPDTTPSINETPSTMPNASTHGSLHGNPVVMSISPDSFTEVSEVGSSGSDNSAGPMDSNADAAGSQFVSIANSDELSSNLVQ